MWWGLTLASSWCRKSSWNSYRLSRLENIVSTLSRSNNLLFSLHFFRNPWRSPEISLTPETLIFLTPAHLNNVLQVFDVVSLRVYDLLHDLRPHLCGGQFPWQRGTGILSPEKGETFFSIKQIFRSKRSNLALWFEDIQNTGTCT